MGRVDPTQVASANVTGGSLSVTTVTFDAPMSAGDQDPVTYGGDVEALGANAPTLCPWPAASQPTSATSFDIPTCKVTSPQTITVYVHGPTVTKQATFTVYPA